MYFPIFLRALITATKLTVFFTMTRSSFRIRLRLRINSNFIPNMESKKARYERILQRYLPEPFVGMVIDLLMEYTVQFKIVKPRKTKLGDFRAKNKHGKAQITINGDLNPYSFLVTTLHEFAHLTNYLEHGHRVAPHGKEWKLHYTRLLLPVIDHPDTPELLRAALLKSTTNMKASSCTDQQLQRTLLTFDS